MFAEKGPHTRDGLRITNMTTPFESELVYRSAYVAQRGSRRAPLVAAYPMRPICKMKE